MMIVSMTGFGHSKKESNRLSVTVEVKTVNHRFCEFYFRMPRQLLKIEDKLKKKLGEHILRGRVEVFVTLSGEAVINRKVQIDWNLLDEYYQYITTIKQKFGIDEPVSLKDLVGREEIINIEENDEENDELEALVIEAVVEAAVSLKQMRQTEGEALARDISDNLTQLKGRLIQVRENSPVVVNQYKERLTKRMQDFLSGQVDESRILTEVAIFAEKADINEELTRLDSHIQQFLKTLSLQEPVGRKLDFLVQEMNREVNTIGSKANDSSIAGEVVEMKSLLEKIKEQVQNIE
jgi:uncharacterized protein (TIGR00255 family)